MFLSFSSHYDIGITAIARKSMSLLELPVVTSGAIVVLEGAKALPFDASHPWPNAPPPYM